MSLITPIDIQLATDRAKNAAKVTDLQGKADALAKDGSGADSEKIWKVACGFEEIFINMMLKQMRQTTWDSGLLGAGNESKIYRDMFDSEIAGLTSQSRRMGLSKIIYDFLSDRGRQAQPDEAVEKAAGQENRADPFKQSLLNRYQSMGEIRQNSD